MADTTHTELDWTLSLALGPLSLQHYDPVPLILQSLTASPILKTHQSALSTLIAELYSNALEHGVLGLDSALKASADGMMAYYQAREVALSALTEGSVTFTLSHAPTRKGGS